MKDYITFFEPAVYRRHHFEGTAFNQFVVVEFLGRKKGSRDLYYLCRCSCGKLLPVKGSVIKRKSRTSCGCAYKVTHGKSRTNTYAIWNCIKQRCFNKNATGYENYGQAGKTMCQGWANSYENFLQDMGERPSKLYSVDRKDSNGNYSCGNCAECRLKKWPMNCRWATDKEQQRNMSNNVYLDWGNESLTIVEWSEKTGIHPGVIGWRLKKGWSIEDILTTPVRSNRR